MEYEKLSIEQEKTTNKYINIKEKKRNTNLHLINELKIKLVNLENKLDFYHKYNNKFLSNDLIDSCIINNINNINNLLLLLDKNIINNGQFSKKTKNKYIEYEF